MYSFILFINKVVKFFTPVWIVTKIAFKIAWLIVGLDFKAGTKKENTMLTMSVVEKAELLNALNETEEWVHFLAHIEEIVIRVLRDDKKQVWYLELMDIVTACISECAEDAMIAFQGTSNIPAQWKLSSTSDKVTFAVQVLISQGKIISGVFLPATPKPE